MKILVMQLARLGDIFQTWPVLSSLKRNFPDSEIHYLCRTSFAEAAININSCDRVWQLDVKNHLDYIFNSDNCADVTKKIGDELSQLASVNFDKIINLSFSPLSSYITEAISGENTEIAGYTRHNDGSLQIPDDPSALIYGQLGVNKFNRIHLTRLFAAVAGVDLLEPDWKVSSDLLAEGALRFTHLPTKYAAIHIGGSTDNKLLSSEQWSALLSKLSNSNPDLSFVLLGSDIEKNFSDQINIKNNNQILNLVGETKLNDLFHIINNSKLLVAPDSSLVHIASLLDKQTINLSFSSVNFWETGPLAKNSYVLWKRSPAEINVEVLANSISNIISGKPPVTDHITIKSNSNMEAYELIGYSPDSFQWNLIKAIYLGEEFPILDKMNVFTAFKQLAELTDMVLRDLEMVRNGQFQNIQLEIVNNVDQLINTLEKLIPEVRPVIWWLNTERLRIGPWEDQVVFDRNYDIFNQLRALLSVYVGTTLLSQQLPGLTKSMEQP